MNLFHSHIYIIVRCVFVWCMATEISSAQTWPVQTITTKPWTRWWWHGSAVNQKDLRETMTLYRQAGLGGLEITPIFGVKGLEQQFIDYLSPHWMDMLSYTLQEAKSLGLGIDMATGTGWPFGGPWIDDLYASKYFVHKIYHLSGGQRLLDTLQFQQIGFIRTANRTRLQTKDLKYPISENKNLQALALDQVRYDTLMQVFAVMAYDQAGHSIDLTLKVSNGMLDWTAPPGTWTLYALFHGLHGKMVERAAPGGEGLVIDHFDHRALLHYLSKFDRSFLNTDLSGLRCFFNDSYEVDDARGQSNWTPLLVEEFFKRRGYNLLDELPALFDTIHNDHTSRVLYDYRETISDLLLEKFTQPWVRWSHDQKKLVRNQSHGSPANILDLYAAVDIPETEGNELSRYKFASSAGHVMNKQLISAEAATWLDEHFQSSLSDVRNCIDRFFLGGVNHIFYHGTAYSPLSDSWPGRLFYAATHFTPANPMWRDFRVLNEYVTRCQSFLQLGTPDNDVLLYFPFADRNHQQGKELLHHFDGMQGYDSTVFKATADSLMHWGYAYDLISDRQIQQLVVQNGKIQSPGGTYQTLLISGAEYLPLPTLKKLDSLHHQGAKILFHTLPASVPGLQQDDQNQMLFKTLLAKYIPMVPPKLHTVLQNESIRNEKGMYHLGLQCIRRKTSHGQFYFIKNSTLKRIEGWIPLQSFGKAAIVYDPMHVQSGSVPIRPGIHGIEAKLRLDPEESLVLDVRDKAVPNKTFNYFDPQEGKSITLHTGWTIQGVVGGPTLPPLTFIDTLQDWVSLPIRDIKLFSGTVSYSTIFIKPKGHSKNYVLDLGRVAESAEIILNGSILSSCIGPRYQITIPSRSFKNKNVLQIKVTNSMANRIIDLDQRNILWKKFYNINMPARIASNTGKDGLFTAAHWAPKPSGLMGPVKLYPMEKAW